MDDGSFTEAEMIRLGRFVVTDYLRDERPLLVDTFLEKLTILTAAHDPKERKTHYCALSKDFVLVPKGCQNAPRYMLIWLDVDGQEALRFEPWKGVDGG